jgi:hypothetical protein
VYNYSLTLILTAHLLSWDVRDAASMPKRDRDMPRDRTGFGHKAQGQLGWLIYPLQIKEHVPVVYGQHSFGFNRCCHT